MTNARRRTDARAPASPRRRPSPRTASGRLGGSARGAHHRRAPPGRRRRRRTSRLPPPRGLCAETGHRASLVGRHRAAQGHDRTRRGCWHPQGSARVEERQDRQHPAVDVRLVRQAELAEQRARVLLHGALAHVERGAIAALFSRWPSRARTSRSRSERPSSGDVVVRGLAGQQRLDDLRVERRPTASDLVQGADELVDVGHPLLEQVAQARPRRRPAARRRSPPRRTATAPPPPCPGARRGCASPPRCPRWCASAASGCR